MYFCSALLTISRVRCMQLMKTTAFVQERIGCLLLLQQSIQSTKQTSDCRRWITLTICSSTLKKKKAQEGV